MYLSVCKSDLILGCYKSVVNMWGWANYFMTINRTLKCTIVCLQYVRRMNPKYSFYILYQNSEGGGGGGGLYVYK